MRIAQQSLSKHVPAKHSDEGSLDNMKGKLCLLAWILRCLDAKNDANVLGNQRMASVTLELYQRDRKRTKS